MTAREILRAAGLPVGRNAAIDYSERLRVAEYYIWKTDTDDQKIAALIGTADLYQDYRIIRSRGGVHALPGGKIRIESREESDFNYPIIQAAKRDAGRYDNETLTMRNRRIANTRLYVKDVWAGKRGEIHRAARRAARLYYRLYGTPPWVTRNAVLDHTFDVDIKPDVDHDNARANQERENRQHAQSVYDRELERIEQLIRLGYATENEAADLREKAKAALDQIVN